MMENNRKPTRTTANGNWDIYEYVIGNQFVCMIANNDCSGNTDEEIEQLKEFEKSLPSTLIVGDELGMSRCEITGMIGDCHECIVLVPKKKVV